MKRPLLVLALTSLLALPSFAQKAPTSQPVVGGLINLDLSGSVSVKDYVDYVRETTGWNVILVGERGVDATTVMMPSMKLKDVSPRQALYVLATVPGVDVEVTIAAEEGNGFYLNADSTPGSRPINLIKLSRPDNRSATQPSAEITLTVFPLEKLLLGDSPKDRIPDDAERAKALAERSEQLLTLADQTFSMVPPAGPKPEFRFHGPTNTLLVKATPADADRVQRLIAALELPGLTYAQRSVNERKLSDDNLQLMNENSRLNTEVLLLKDALFKANGAQRANGATTKPTE